MFYEKHAFIPPVIDKIIDTIGRFAKGVSKLLLRSSILYIACDVLYKSDD